MVAYAFAQSSESYRCWAAFRCSTYGTGIPAFTSNRVAPTTQTTSQNLAGGSLPPGQPPDGLKYSSWNSPYGLFVFCPADAASCCASLAQGLLVAVVKARARCAGTTELHLLRRARVRNVAAPSFACDTASSLPILLVPNPRPQPAAAQQHLLLPSRASATTGSHPSPRVATRGRSCRRD